MNLRVVLLPLLVGACFDTNFVYCDDGRVCPTGTVCDVAHASCAQPEQITACAGREDGAPCEGLSGICDLGTCTPGCGDGARSSIEECDDGNFVNHDGCSSVCVLETPRWEPWRDPEPWTARTSHTAAFDPAHGHLVIVGGSGPAGVGETAWQRDYALFDHDDWARIPSPPEARNHAAMAFDANRGVLVLFGGATGLVNTMLTNTTWEFNGTTWVQKSLPVSPPARSGAAMFYDPLRGRIVLFGGATLAGSVGDTWEYDGTTWTSFGGTAPSGREGAAVTWDAAGQRAVLFGGRNSSGNLCDTWQRVGTTWSQVTFSAMAALPECRAYAGLAFYPGLDHVVMFGGELVFAVASDTWEYDGADWTRITVGASAPPGRARHTFTYDASSNRLVVVGGDNGTDAFADIWEYTSDGTWQQSKPEFGSPAPSVRSLVFDADANELVLFSGQQPKTWAFSGDRWVIRDAVDHPAIDRVGAASAYDPDRGVVTLGGVGSLGAFATGMFAWRNRIWTSLPAAVEPTGRVFASMAYSAALGRLVLFGGTATFDATGALGDTWEYDGSTWILRDFTGLPHPAATIAPAMEYDRDRGQIVLFDSAGATWLYDASGWTRFATTGDPAGRSVSRMIYDPRRHADVMFGGSLPNGDVLDDGWELRDATWTNLGVTTPARLSLATALDESTATILLFGGSTGMSASGDTWLFRYRSATPDEVCGNGIDDDGDGWADSSDPDCH